MIKFKAYLTGFLLAWFILYANTAWSLSTPAPLPSAVMHNSIIEIGKMKPKPRLDKKKKGTGTQAHRQQIIKQIERRQWEREALETLKQQIRKPNPSEQMYFTFLKGGLVFQEGGPNGGRTIEYYVGLSEKGLKTRYTYDKALMRPDGTKIDYVSTFRSLREAELLIEKTMQENMKTSQGRKDMSDLVKGARQELIWQHNFHSSTGHMLNGPKGDIIDAYGVQVRLRHADSTNGWRLLEAMPVKGKISEKLREFTPFTHPSEFESIRGRDAVRNKKNKEIWVKDRLHKDHYEVYKNLKDFEKGRRSRSVWNDGRLKEIFK
tara:strand:- start:5 stop:964 length:960 start_codon:yes stop_codon:yes gene_type:complete